MQLHNQPRGEKKGKFSLVQGVKYSKPLKISVMSNTNPIENDKSCPAWRELSNLPENMGSQTSKSFPRKQNYTANETTSE